MSWVRGDSNVVTMTITEDGAAVDLAGAAFALRLARDLGATGDDILVSKSTDDFSVSGNVATCTLDPADTAALSPGLYWVEVQATDASGNVTTAQGHTYIGIDTV